MRESIYLLRCNPALSTNVKLVCDSSYNLYLESYDANEQLSNTAYKKFPVSPDSFISERISTFYTNNNNTSSTNNSNLPSSLAFGARQDITSDTVQTTVDNQYDDLYYSGPRITADTRYAEQFQYNTTLKIEPTNLPQWFFIFRQDGTGFDPTGGKLGFSIVTGTTLIYNEQITGGTSNAVATITSINPGGTLSYVGIVGGPFIIGETITGSVSTATAIVESINISQDDMSFSNLKTIQWFDLSSTTAIGQLFQKNYIKDETLPRSAFELNLKPYEFSTWNGYDYNFGGVASKSLFLDDYFQAETTHFEMEKFITDGFQINEIVCANYLNISFLYDDQVSGVLIPGINYDLNGQYKCLNEAIYEGDFILNTDITYPNSPDASGAVNAQVLDYKSFDKNWSLNRYYGFYLQGLNELHQVSPCGPATFQTTGVSVYQNQFIVTGTQITGPIVPVNPLANAWNPNKVYYIKIGNTLYLIEQNQDATGVYHYVIVSNMVFNPTGEGTLDALIADYDPVIKIVWNAVLNMPEIVYLNGDPFQFGYNQSLTLTDSMLMINMYGNYFTLNYQAQIIDPNTGDIINPGYCYIVTDNYITCDGNKYLQKTGSNQVTTNFTQLLSKDYQVPYFYFYQAVFTEVADFDFQRDQTNYARIEYDFYSKVNLARPLLVETNILDTGSPKDYFHETGYRVNTYSSKNVQANANYADYLAVATILPNIVAFASVAGLNIGDTLVLNPGGLSYPVTGISNLPLTNSVTFDYSVNGEIPSLVTDATKPLNYRDYPFLSYTTNTITFIDATGLNIGDQMTVIDGTSHVYKIILIQGNIATFDVTAGNLPVTITDVYRMINYYPYDTTTPYNIPLTSEYAVTGDLYMLDSNENMTEIWDVNQHTNKWGFAGSVNYCSYPYKINNDLTHSGPYNFTPNPYSTTTTSLELSLDWFYTSGIPYLQSIDQITTTGTFYNNVEPDIIFTSLNIPTSVKGVPSTLDFTYFDRFDFDYYTDPNSTFDIFDSFFNRYGLSNEKLNRIAQFGTNDGVNGPMVLFRGINCYLEYGMTDNPNAPKGVQFSPATDADGYSFSAIFDNIELPATVVTDQSGIINPLWGQAGIDVVVNKNFKNVLIHVYVYTPINAVTSLHYRRRDLVYDEKYINYIYWDNNALQYSHFNTSLKTQSLKLNVLYYILNNSLTTHPDFDAGITYQIIENNPQYPILALSGPFNSTVPTFDTTINGYTISITLSSYVTFKAGDWVYLNLLGVQPANYLVSKRSSGQVLELLIQNQPTVPVFSGTPYITAEVPVVPFRLRCIYPDEISLNQAITNIIADTSAPITPANQQKSIGGTLQNDISIQDTLQYVWTGNPLNRQKVIQPSPSELSYKAIDNLPIIYRYSGDYEPILNRVDLFNNTTLLDYGKTLPLSTVPFLKNFYISSQTINGVAGYYLVVEFYANNSLLFLQNPIAVGDIIYLFGQTYPIIGGTNYIYTYPEINKKYATALVVNTYFDNTLSSLINPTTGNYYPEGQTVYQVVTSLQFESVLPNYPINNPSTTTPFRFFQFDAVISKNIQANTYLDSELLNYALNKRIVIGKLTLDKQSPLKSANPLYNTTNKYAMSDEHGVTTIDRNIWKASWDLEYYYLIYKNKYHNSGGSNSNASATGGTGVSPTIPPTA